MIDNDTEAARSVLQPAVVERMETTEEERADWLKRADDAGRLARDFSRLQSEAARLTAVPEDVEGLVGELDRLAVSASEAHKMLADAKTARNRAAEGEPWDKATDPGYSWPTPEQTAEGRAAAALRSQAAALAVEWQARERAERELANETERLNAAIIGMEGYALERIQQRRRAEAAEARVKALEDGLRPFADYANRLDNDAGGPIADAVRLSLNFQLLDNRAHVGDLRRARALLAPADQKENE